MALKQLLITRKIAELEKEQSELAKKIAATAERRAAWKAREAQAETALGEMDDNTTAEERSAFETECSEIEAEDTAITADETAQNTRSGEIEDELTKLRGELDELNTRAKQAAEPPKHQNKGAESTMRITGHPNADYRERLRAAVSLPETRTFLGDIRNIVRGITNAPLTVPVAVLPLLREKVEQYSKLLKYTNFQSIRGDAKQPILAAPPEAVWTVNTGKINEVNLGLYGINLGSHKISAYVGIPNPYIEDSDENLLDISLTAIGQGIGIGVDKAILYGTGTNMPVGIIPRLTATAKPGYWDTLMTGDFAAMTSHVGKQSAAEVTGDALLKELFTVLGRAKDKTGTGKKFWAMSEETHTSLLVMAMNYSASGAIVAGINDEMPILGGKIETFDFMPSGVITGGYGGGYTLVERSGAKLTTSEHVKMLDDMTVCVGTARYDGAPGIADSFAAFSLNQTAVSGTAVTFTQDKANA